MKFNANSLLPILIVLGGGMATGSLHNAMARGRIGAPIGYIFILLTVMMFLAGFVILWHYDGTVSYRLALGCAIFVAFLGIFNVVTTLSDPNALSMLFHEYLNPIVGVLQVGKLLTERSR